jgi:hypothetical protein
LGVDRPAVVAIVSRRVTRPTVVAIVSRRVTRPTVVAIVSRRVTRPTVVSIVSLGVARAAIVLVVSAIDAVIVCLDVIVVDVPVDRIVVIDVVHVHGAVDDVSVDVDVGVAIVDVDVVVDIHVDAAAANPAAIPATGAPASGMPAGVIDAAPAAAVAPTKAQVQPDTDGIADAKGDGRAVVGPAIVNDGGVIDGDVDVLRLIGIDGDVVVLLENFLLLRRLQISSGASHVAKALNRRCDVGGLVDVGLPNRSGPVNLVSHHADDGGVVRDGAHADIPVLIVNAIVAIGADVARGFLDLVGKR